MRGVLAFLVLVVVPAAERLDVPSEPRAGLLQALPFPGNPLRQTPPSRLGQGGAHPLSQLLDLTLQEGVDGRQLCIERCLGKRSQLRR